MTSDLERELVLEQNDRLRERVPRQQTEVFQRLRRCCICLQPSCAEQALCRAEFAEWAQRKWDKAIDDELARRG